jgi:hypothetical protein
MKTEIGYMTKKAAAAFTTLSPRSLDYARDRGDLPFLQIGRRVAFQVRDLEQYMQRFRVDARQKVG